MVAHFESPYFRLMPAKEDVVGRLGELGVRDVRDLRLFKFSSCTPTLCVELESRNGSPRRLVLRGEQQNDLLVMAPEERSLEKEMWMLKRIRDLGLHVPKVLFDGRVFSVPAYDAQGNPASDFKFFLMEYVEGMAMDRRIKSASVSERIGLLGRVAEIYARIHAVRGTEYGLADGEGRAVGGHSDLREFLTSRLNRLATLTWQLGEEPLANEIRSFAAETIARLCADLAQSDYVPQPRLVLYDGFCGNMLIGGDTISLIDMAMAGWFEPVTEFCAFIYPLKTMLLERSGNRRYWDHFTDAYREHGGVLPSADLTARLLHVMFVHVLVHQLIYWKESPGKDKQAKAGPLARTVSSMMRAKPQSIDDVVQMI